MKTKRRLLALTCSLLTLLFLPMNAYAAGAPDAASESVIPPEDGTTTYVNEFQRLFLLKCTPEEELAATGYSKEDITAIKEFSLEKALLERAQYSEDQLLGMGYSLEEVQLLKSYNGEPITPDNLATYAVLSAELTGSIEIVRRWVDMVDVKYHWEWDQPPLNKFTDLITCGWTAYNAYGLHLSTSPNIARCGSHIVYTPWNDDTIHHIRNYVVSSDPTYNTDMLILSSTASTAKAKIPLLDDNYFARSGFLHISIVPDGTQAEMEGAKFGFAYAHNTASVDLSLSIYVIGLTINLPEDDSVVDTAEVTVTNLY